MNDAVKKENRDLEVTQNRQVFIPQTDIRENDEAIVVVCDMPGVLREKIGVQLENHVLTLTGEQEEESFGEGYEQLHQGYCTGVYRRSFTVTPDVDAEKITARLTDGVLTVTLPKAEKARLRKIEVQSE